MSYGIKISKEGYDVVTETDQKNLVFDSSVNHLKTAGSGTISKTVSANSTVVESVAHSLAIRPLVLAYFRDTSNSNWMITMAQPETTKERYYSSLNVEVYVDTSNIYFKIINNYASQKTAEIKYEYFYEGDS